MAASPTTTTTPGKSFAYAVSFLVPWSCANLLLGHKCMKDKPHLMTKTNDPPVFYSLTLSIFGVGGSLQPCRGGPIAATRLTRRDLVFGFG